MKLPPRKPFSSSAFVERRGTLFLLFALALTAIVLSTWQGISYFVAKNERAALTQSLSLSALNNLHERAAGELSGPVSSMHVVTLSPIMRAPPEQWGRFSDEVADLLQAMMQANPDIFQVRFVDAAGGEQIQVDRESTGFRRVQAPASDIQADEPPINAGPLEAGKIYVSDLELRTEAGVVLEPWTPVIRIATPIQRADGSPTGILIVKVDAQEIVDNYKQVNRVSGRVDVLLANGDGDWLYGAAGDRNWGFMFGRSYKFSDDYPRIWQHILSGERRIFNEGADRWTYQPLRVADLFPATLSYERPDHVLWYAIIKNPPTPIVGGPLGFIPVLVIIAAILAFSWISAQSVMERRRAQEDLMKSEKMSALGGLVAGVAHELNTPIGSAVTIASTLQENASELEHTIAQGKVKKTEIVEFVGDVKEASLIMLRGLDRATELLNHFKQVAVDQSGEQQRVFDLDGYIEELVVTFNHLFKHRPVVLELELQARTQLNSFPGSLGQVIINLVQNALTHGFETEEAGYIRITTRRRGDKEVDVVVADNGRGIPEEIIERVFDPFFTTKLGQGGSGLGLHIAYNLVTEVLSGQISIVSNQQRRFTQVMITFPITHPGPTTRLVPRTRSYPEAHPDRTKISARGVGNAEKPTPEQ